MTPLEEKGTRLPKEYIDWIVAPITRFIKVEAAAGVILFLVTALTLVLSNTSFNHFLIEFWETPAGFQFGTFSFSRTLHGWINDAVMTLFFFLIALELKRELVLGELKSPRLAMLSVSAALGGMIVPALVYLVFQYGEVAQGGWGTVMASDTAFIIGCLALLGRKISKSLRVFMLSLAVVDDIGAILVVAIGYGSELNWFAIGLALIGVLLVQVVAFLGIRSILLFMLIGAFIWLAIDHSGVHPTVTGVILGLLTPTKRWVSDERLHTIMDSIVAYAPGDHWSGDTPDRQALRTAEAAARETLSPVERLEMILHPWVGFVVMPLFAFANAGVVFSEVQLDYSLNMAVVAGFILGKPVGVLLFSWVAVKTKLAIKPVSMSWPVITGGGLLAGIGFTMALFIANLAFDAEQLDTVKLSILFASVLSAITGCAVLWFFSKNPDTNNV